ncbi:hypothetical protein GIB67_000963 [Kingdonia uniflora]|uniref:Uncharacterized protein n=1 Tax=Kingdonia uniflora TaxID=39325 RepID=A0A7J7MG11_9MAGN|nr:hypothetical protein GIB67_000963 [Kingdonia uniflora]
MAHQPGYGPPAMANPIAVIGPQYCASYPVDLTVIEKVISIVGNFVVSDVNGNIIFKVKRAMFSIRRVLFDATGNPLVSIRQKAMSRHGRWQVYRGDSSSSRDLLFTVRKSSLLQFKTELQVFLANNTRENVCDFKIKCSWLERSCVVYLGESSNIIAQMDRKGILFGRNTLSVAVYPHIDHAFITSLIVILNGINED